MAIFQNLKIVNAIGFSSYLKRKRYGTLFAASIVIVPSFLVHCIEIMIKIPFTA